MKAAGAVWLARRCRALVFGILAVAALPLLAPGAAGALDVPPGYQLDVPIKGVQRPAALAFSPGTGDVFVAERNGTVRVFNGIHDPKPALSLDITDEVHSFVDRGMLGMVLDPEYPVRPYLYLSYTYDARPGGEAPTHERFDGSNTCKNLETGVDELPDDCVVTGRVSRVELDPSTGIAVENGLTPLVTDWCQQYQSHSMGDLKFDSEGALLATGGDGANFAALDYGQFGNPCGDPEYEGGALRSQDIRGRWNDPTGYNGSIIRIDPDSGDPWPTNEQFGSEDSKVRRMVAYGLRNPFRLAIRPGTTEPTTELYIADVGSSYVDEINLIPNPAEQKNGWPSNFGWPCFEDADPHPGFQALAFSVPLEICRRLYESAPVNLRSPIFSYPRLGGLFGDDKCEPSSGAALAGLSFYERPATGLRGRLAEELDGALLIADAARGCVWAMGAGGDGKPDPGELRNLIARTPADEGAFTPVNFAVDSDGALYIPDFWGNRIVRLRHFEGNQPPVARIKADPYYGDMEGGVFEVEFDGSDSTDADGESLTYEWDLDEDGEFEVGPTDSTLLYTYDQEVNFIAQLRVTDEEGATSVDRMTLYPGNHPPEVPTMESPRDDILWTVGDKISLAGSATDEDEGDEVRLNWDVLIWHCPDNCHSHSLAHVSGAEPEPITAPDHEYPSHLQVTLTATDNRDMSEQTTRDIHPRTVAVTLDSVPPGAPLTIASTTRPAPFAEPLLAGGAATVSAPETAVIGGRQYTFASWSNGRTRTHLANWPQSETLIARYAAVPSIVPPPPPPPKRVKLRFVSRPAALPLRVGRGWRRAPFHRWVARGHRPRIAAPRRVRRGGRVHIFSHWRHGGRHRVQKVKAVGPRAYVAVFRSRPDRKRKR